MRDDFNWPGWTLAIVIALIFAYAASIPLRMTLDYYCPMPCVIWR